MALDVDGESHIVIFIWILWAAARALIVHDQPEAPSLSAEIIGGLSYLDMSMGDRTMWEKWFANPVHQEIAAIVGYDSAQVEAGEGGVGEDLTEEDLRLLRGLAAGSATADDEVSELLAKLGVASENEAIQYAIRAGVTWQ